MDMVVPVIIFSLLGTLYCLPGIIASERKKRNAPAIWTLNLLLGWSLIGWVVALVWAVTSEYKHMADPVSSDGPYTHWSQR